MYIVKYETMVEKRGRILGTLGAEQQYSAGFPEFSFCLIYTRLGGEKARNFESTNRCRSRRPPEKLLSLGKDNKRGHQARQNLQIISYGGQTPQRKTVPLRTRRMSNSMKDRQPIDADTELTKILNNEDFIFF